MTHAITDVIGRRVRETRKRQGLTAQQLADLMRDCGVAWNRSIVANLENGRRQDVTVVELLALGRVLHVAPIHLLVPPTNDGTFHVTPNEAQPPSMARSWIRGAEALNGTDMRIFRTEVPLDELGR